MKKLLYLLITYDNNQTFILDWTEINKHFLSIDKPNANIESYITNHSKLCFSNSHEALGKLCRELVERNCAEPVSQWVTSTPTYIIRQTMQNIMSPTYSVSEWQSFTNYESIFNYLKDNSTIAYVTGQCKGGDGGHGWIMSGAEKVIKTYKGIKIDGSDEVVEEIYFNYNWGWCGMHNGYFKAGVFDTTKATTSRSCNIDKREHNLSESVQLFWVTE